MAGISHPLFGADHILAMVAVGLWASQFGLGFVISTALLHAADVGIGPGIALSRLGPLVTRLLDVATVFGGAAIAFG